MGFLRILAVLALAALASCGEDTRDYPTLMPTDQVLAEPTLPAHASDAAHDPGPASAALEARARALAGGAGPANLGTDSKLQRRAEDLRARARALSRQSLDGDCPADTAGCAPAPAPN